MLEIIDRHVAQVTLNRPDKRNAVNGVLTQAMTRILNVIEGDSAIRVAILASSNPTMFCAGADLSEVAAGLSNLIMPLDGGFAGFVMASRSKPWIAAVGGTAAGGGFELVLACDMVVAAHQARFMLPEVKVGLLAAGGGMHRLSRALPRNIALELLTTGDSISAERAFALGLVNRLVESDVVISEARALARSVAANAPLAVRESLAIGRIAGEFSDEYLYERSLRSHHNIVATEDATEGPRAFLEKRRPVWKGT
jgi:enoyl-CoA hydratase/carnithine racemase